MKTPNRIDLFQADTQNSIPYGYYRLVKDEVGPAGNLPQLCVFAELKESSPESHFIVDAELYHAIADGDIGLVTARGSVRVILSERANQNTLLLTERCDNRCVFCSQPPKEDDDSWLLSSAEKALLDFEYGGVIGLSGGEPLLYGQRLLSMLRRVLSERNDISFHILSNGRALADADFCNSVGEIARSGRVVFGIPLYGASGKTHDDCVGTEGAFVDTLTGLVNAGNLGIPIEIRFIPTSLNVSDIVSVIELVGRSISSLSQVSIMNLEPTGWAKHNWKSLYLSPFEYQKELMQAIKKSQELGLRLALFNYPLCHLSEDCRDFAVKSISDWKNFFPPECDGCALEQECGGYFTSTGGERFDPPRRIQK